MSQYFGFLGNVFRGDLGVSIFRSMPVQAVIRDAPRSRSSWRSPANSSTC